MPMPLSRKNQECNVNHTRGPHGSKEISKLAESPVQITILLINEVNNRFTENILLPADPKEK